MSHPHPTPPHYQRHPQHITLFGLDTCVSKGEPSQSVFLCRHYPSDVLVVHGENFDATTNDVLADGVPICTSVDTLSTSELHCVLSAPQQSAAITTVKHVDGEQVVSQPKQLTINIETLTPTLTVTESATQSVIPTCIRSHWLGVQCSCEEAEHFSFCGSSLFYSHVCDLPAVVTEQARICTPYRKCVHGLYLPNCICLEAPDEAWCSDGDVLTADGRCDEGSCKATPICTPVAVPVCTCTDAPRMTLCNQGEWVCNGEGSCVEVLERLSVFVIPQPKGSTEDKNSVPVDVRFSTGDFPADSVVLLIDIEADAQQMLITPPEYCSNVTSPPGHTYLRCPQGDLPSQHVGTVKLLLQPVDELRSSVPIHASLMSPSMKQTEDRHSHSANVVLPLSNLAIEFTGTEGSSTEYTVTNHGPATAENVLIHVWSVGTNVATERHTNETIRYLAAGDNVTRWFVPPFSGNASIYYSMVTVNVSSNSADHNLGNNVATKRVGPFYIAPGSRVQRTATVQFMETDAVKFLSAEDYFTGSDSMTYLKFFMFEIVLIFAVWVTVSYRPVGGTKAQLEAHTAWNQPAAVPSKPLPMFEDLFNFVTDEREKRD